MIATMGCGTAAARIASAKLVYCTGAATSTREILIISDNRDSHDGTSSGYREISVTGYEETPTIICIHYIPNKISETIKYLYNKKSFDYSWTLRNQLRKFNQFKNYKQHFIKPYRMDRLIGKREKRIGRKDKCQQTSFN
jgi:hypothetical protein